MRKYDCSLPYAVLGSTELGEAGRGWLDIHPAVSGEGQPLLTALHSIPYTTALQKVTQLGGGSIQACSGGPPAAAPLWISNRLLSSCLKYLGT